MKKVTAILLAVLLAWFFYNGYVGDSLKFIMSDAGDRVSAKYIDKSVGGNTKEVVFGKSSGLEDGSANIVTSIVVDYRAFDTLGEVTVLFLTATAVALLMGGLEKKLLFLTEPSFILKAGAKLTFGFILLVGTFMFTHGHLTPGGGFPGGSMIAGAFLLLYLGDSGFRTRMKSWKVLEGVMGSIFVLVGAFGLLAASAFLQNFLPTGTVGDLFSAGIIPIVYILVGLKVGAEIIGLIDRFMSEEVAS
jgi:multicomponent Na+:H+ antiporter subunit B